MQRSQDIIDIWDQFQKPVILKGTRLAGGVHQMINNKDEIEEKYAALCKTVDSDFFRARKSEIMIQEWMKYGMTDMWSCETVYDKKSQPMGFFSIERIRSSLNYEGLYTSYLFAGEHVRSDELEKTTEKIMNHIGWKGFAHVEYFFVPGEQIFYLTEINPRLPGYSYYPSQAGFDMAYYYYMDLIEEKIDHPQSYPDSVFFSALMHPGDISGGIVHIAKGNQKLLPFLQSYLKLFKREYVKIVDPIRLDDPSFTLAYVMDEISPALKKGLRFCKQKIKSLPRFGNSKN
jgi:predicted ATP-grasp superfamily ATP-dependent carboligase